MTARLDRIRKGEETPDSLIDSKANLVKVFISSLITGMGTVRKAAREAVTTLRHQPIMAEDFGAQPNSPQVACLTGLRQSELVVLILGDHYGAEQPSGLSATHEEYREAKGCKPVIAFVQEGGNRDRQQAEFVKEVQEWEGGLFRGAFETAPDLNVALTRALHDYELANAVGPVDQQELTERAEALLPRERSGYSGDAALNLAVAGGPRQSILRPVEIEATTLAEALHQAALFGHQRIFNPSLGVQRELKGEALRLSQERGPNQILINEQGSVCVTLPIREERERMPEIIHEVIQKKLADGIAFISGVLDRVDSTQRLTHIAASLNITNASYMGWRTQRESDANPNSISIGHAFGNEQRSSVCVNRPRASLRLDSARIVEDLLVLLRRQWR